ncbi:hypothetical protein MYXO_00955 [Myxococcaceae bacterium]|nr:hypothetical protein MYXO_00955 [Myxococcaceae bacterium]
MSGGEKPSCTECGTPVEKYSLVRGEARYCLRCAGKVPLLPCPGCGKNTRMAGPDGSPLCKSCRTKGRTCLHCGRDLPKASLLVEDGALCWPCSRHYREPETCDVCGQSDLFWSHVELDGARRRVCHRCLKKQEGHATCAACRKHRKPAGATADGKPVCKRCLESGCKPFICPQCGKEGIRHSASQCLGCYHKGQVLKRAAQAAAMLQHGWCRKAFGDFGPALLESVPAASALMRIDRYFLLFARLDAAFDAPTKITPDALLAAAGGLDGLRRFAIPYGFLLKEGLIPGMTRDLLADSAEMDRQRHLLESAEGTWFHPLLLRFQGYLMEVHARYERRGWRKGGNRMKLRTVTQGLRAARKFCLAMGEKEGVSGAQQITIDHAERFVAENPGLAMSIRSFLRYLNLKEKLFRKIKLKAVKRDLREGAFLPRQKYLELLRGWLNPDGKSVRESLIGLFLLLYAQPVNKVVRIKLSDLSRDRNGQYRLVFGSAEIAVDPRVSALVDRCLEDRKALSAMDDAAENEYLFTGRNHGGHLTPAAVTHMLGKAGVTAEQLFATSIYNAYRSGLDHPKVLVRAFGITTATAIKYMQKIDPQLVHEIEKKAYRAA